MALLRCQQNDNDFRIMPDADMYEISDASDADWDGLVRGALGGTVFSTRAWLECAQEATGDRAVNYGCYKKGEIVAGVSGIERRRGRQFTTPPLTPHGGFIHRPVPSDLPSRQESERRGETRALIEFLESRYGHVHLTLAPGIDDVREFSWAGWNPAPRYTYVTDLGCGSDAVWSRLERRTRTVIRKASERFRFEPADDLDELVQQYELVYTEQDPPPVAADVMRRFASAARERGLAEAWRVVDDRGRTASVVVFARGFDTIYAWIAGADPAFRDSGATSFLYWKLLEQTGFPRFDFVGANLPAIAFFKRGFGGSLVSYYAVEAFPSRLLRLLAGGRRLLRGS